MWFYHKNKQLQDKRVNEETLAFLREWRIARGRMETEIQRRKENRNDATNFQKARGFVRTCWKTKNWPIEKDPTQYDSSEDSEDEREMVEEEMRDRVVAGSSASPSPTRKALHQSSNLKSDFSASAHDSRFLTDPKIRRKALS